MSRGQFRVDATNPNFSDGTQQQAIAYHDPKIQQNDNDLALVPRSPVAVQTLQGAGVEDTVANAPRKLVLEREAVREATDLRAAISAGALLYTF